MTGASLIRVSALTPRPRLDDNPIPVDRERRFFVVVFLPIVSKSYPAPPPHPRPSFTPNHLRSAVPRSSLSSPWSSGSKIRTKTSSRPTEEPRIKRINISPLPHPPTRKHQECPAEAPEPSHSRVDDGDAPGTTEVPRGRRVGGGRPAQVTTTATLGRVGTRSRERAQYRTGPE